MLHDPSYGRYAPRLPSFEPLLADGMLHDHSDYGADSSGLHMLFIVLILGCMVLAIYALTISKSSHVEWGKAT